MPSKKRPPTQQEELVKIVREELGVDCGPHFLTQARLFARSLKANRATRLREKAEKAKKSLKNAIKALKRLDPVFRNYISANVEAPLEDRVGRTINDLEILDTRISNYLASVENRRGRRPDIPRLEFFNYLVATWLVIKKERPSRSESKHGVNIPRQGSFPRFVQRCFECLGMPLSVSKIDHWIRDWQESPRVQLLPIKKSSPRSRH